MEEAGPDPARLLRGWPGRRPVRAAGSRRPPARPARAGRARGRRGACPPARRRRSGEPVRRVARRGPGAPRPTGGCSSAPQARTSSWSMGRRSLYVDRGGGIDPAVPRRRRPGGRWPPAFRAPHGARRGRTGPRAGASAKIDGEPAGDVSPTASACSTPGSCPAIAAWSCDRRRWTVERRTDRPGRTRRPVAPARQIRGRLADARVIRMGRG